MKIRVTWLGSLSEGTICSWASVQYFSTKAFINPLFQYYLQLTRLSIPLYQIFFTGETLFPFQKLLSPLHSKAQPPHAPDTTEKQWCWQKRERCWSNNKIITARLPPWVSPLGKAGMCCSCTHSCSRGSLCMHSLTQPALHHPHGSRCWGGIIHQNYFNTSLSQTVCVSQESITGKNICVFCYRAASPQGHSTKSWDCMAVSWDVIQVPGILLLQINDLLIKNLYLHRHWMLSKTALNLESGQFIHCFSGYVRAQLVFLGSDWDF